MIARYKEVSERSDNEVIESSSIVSTIGLRIMSRCVDHLNKI